MQCNVSGMVCITEGRDGMNTASDENYEDLANGIVVQAVRDYRSALRRLKRDPQDSTALYAKKEVERFFNSEWFKLLTKIDPVKLMEKLNEEGAE